MAGGDITLRIFWVAAGVFLLDQAIKFFFAGNFVPGESFPIIQNIFHLTYVQNTGAAFGIFRGARIFILVASLIVFSAVLVYVILRRPRHRLIQVAFGAILGGSLSNLLDRLFRGYVVDYFDFRVWPVFNVGDAMINIGAATLVIYMLLGKKETL